jgi:hypothetical protein
LLLWLAGKLYDYYMNDLSYADRREVLGEVLADQLQAILEYVKEIPIIKEGLSSIEIRLSNVESLLRMHEADIVYLRQKIA